MTPAPGDTLVITRLSGNQPPRRREVVVEVVEVCRHLPVHVGDTVRTIGAYGPRVGVVTRRTGHGAVWTTDANGASTHAWREGIREVLACPHDDDTEPDELMFVTVRLPDGRTTHLPPHEVRAARRPLDPTPPGPSVSGLQGDLFELLEVGA